MSLLGIDWDSNPAYKTVIEALDGDWRYMNDLILDGVIPGEWAMAHCNMGWVFNWALLNELKALRRQRLEEEDARTG